VEFVRGVAEVLECQVEVFGYWDGMGCAEESAGEDVLAPLDAWRVRKLLLESFFGENLEG
jgi:hypothetical protein